VAASVTDHQAEVDRLLAEYRRSREQLAAVCRALAAIAASQTSSDGMVTVTVGAQGALTGLRIEPDAYRRYRPADLADLIVGLATAAAEQAAARAQRVLEPVLPPGADPAAVLAGTADLRPREITPPVPGDADESLDGKTWLEHAHRGRRS
jgi:DNA-binding protein YbaB